MLQTDELPPRLRETLYRAGVVTCEAILESRDCDLLNLGLEAGTLHRLRAQAACQARPSSLIKGAELAVSVEGRGSGRWGRLTTGCPALDSLLQGGVLTRGITELAGQSGCGKTQLCLQLALTTQLPLSAGGLAAGAAFICTEDRFPSSRLQQLVQSLPLARQHPDIQFGDNIFVEHVADTTELLRVVGERLSQLTQKHSLGLVVLDSVAAVFRADYSASESLQRARDMRMLASSLHLLASTKNIAVVCVNQVSDVQRGEVSQTVPALGLAWANLVTCRLQMFRSHQHRQLRVIFSPHLPQRLCQYSITAAGVSGLGHPVTC